MFIMAMVRVLCIALNFDCGFARMAGALGVRCAGDLGAAGDVGDYSNRPFEYGTLGLCNEVIIW